MMKEKRQIIGRLVVGMSLAIGLISNTHAALTPEQRAQMEESIRQLEEATSNMMAQAQATRALRPAPTAAQIAAAQSASADADRANFETNFAHWIVHEVLLPDNSAVIAGGLENQNSNALVSLSATISSGYAQQQAAVADFVQTNILGLPSWWTDTN